MYSERVFYLCLCQYFKNDCIYSEILSKHIYICNTVLLINKLLTTVSIFCKIE